MNPCGLFTTAPLWLNKTAAEKETAKVIPAASHTVNPCNWDAYLAVPNAKVNSRVHRFLSAVIKITDQRCGLLLMAESSARGQNNISKRKANAEHVHSKQHRRSGSDPQKSYSSSHSRAKKIRHALLQPRCNCKLLKNNYFPTVARQIIVWMNFCIWQTKIHAEHLANEAQQQQGSTSRSGPPGAALSLQQKAQLCLLPSHCCAAGQMCSQPSSSTQCWGTLLLALFVESPSSHKAPVQRLFNRCLVSFHLTLPELEHCNTKLTNTCFQS